MAAETLPGIKKGADLKTLKTIIVGHDFSEGADHALADAMALSRRFHSEIIVAHVEEPETPGLLEGSLSNRKSRANIALQDIRKRIDLAGHPCRKVLRSGDVAKRLIEIGDEEDADLLLLGAYGHGSKDRKTLGATTERLLRSMSCPVLTYGPKVNNATFRWQEGMSILVPIELPCEERYLKFAISVAKLFQARLEVLHVVDMNRALSMPHAFQDMAYTCENIACHLRAGEVSVSASLLFGEPEKAIVSRSQELCSSLILMPLETRRSLSSPTSDNVAASVIRSAVTPVMTYRIN
jgi:nucleotide-binding universal stress UspA family protein